MSEPEAIFTTEMVISKIEGFGGSMAEVTLSDDVDGSHAAVRNWVGDPVGPSGFVPEVKMLMGRTAVCVGDRFLVTVARPATKPVYVKPPGSDAR